KNQQNYGELQLPDIRRKSTSMRLPREMPNQTVHNWELCIRVLTRHRNLAILGSYPTPFPSRVTVVFEAALKWP
ncbi:MAG: hypothetical protein PHQ58_16525, partial [Rhodoferax sp.]|uniref:hypothetical protein n=1 Tax=Rhodoferax sp. TaxID=50421 RepID=UPI0026281412